MYVNKKKTSNKEQVNHKKSYFGKKRGLLKRPFIQFFLLIDFLKKWEMTKVNNSKEF